WVKPQVSRGAQQSEQGQPQGPGGNLQHQLLNPPEGQAEHQQQRQPDPGNYLLIKGVQHGSTSPGVLPCHRIPSLAMHARSISWRVQRLCRNSAILPSTRHRLPSAVTNPKRQRGPTSLTLRVSFESVSDVGPR